MYEFSKAEENVIKYWEENSIYPKIKERNQKGKKFYFLQGPPYTSGRLHIAHAWNNALKDIVLRYKRMKGFNVWDRAGYDMHGLPTENKVQAKLGLKFKEDIVEYGVAKFVEECIRFSVENAKLMDKDLWRLGVWMDYPNAYYPIKNSFIEGEWWLIKRAFEDNRIYKGRKIMHWCSSCETSLAKHELEYETVPENSIFLKFKVKGKENEYLIIWTTTPWTIPFNLAVMVNPGLDYVKADVDGEAWIIAKGLAGGFLGMVVGKPLVIMAELKGKELEGLRYEHPLYDELKIHFDEIAKKSKNLHTVILSGQYVTLEAGSGLVHCAPGCGPEDFEVGKEYGLPAFNMLNEKGQFEDMGVFSGFTAKVDDFKFIKFLDEKKALVKTANVEHEYAHCWRCHKPVVFRAVEQWFMKIEDLIPQMLEAGKGIGWVPNSSALTFESWVKALRDNSIVRQRFWGSPAPIWECGKCGKAIVVGSVEDLKAIATTKVPENLHRPWIDEVKVRCSCGAEAERVPDVVDVWIDAGTASWNCLDYPARKDLFKDYFPADFILEATEQIRLWFSMLHICSTLAFGMPCYKNVYTHGMILDYQGMKMSKSLGNIISPYEVVDKHGADVLRYYICGTKAGENINFSLEEVKLKQRSLVIFWNIHNYIIDLYKEVKAKPQSLKVKGDTEEDYILSRVNSTVKKVNKLMKDYRIDEVIPIIESLLLDISREYIQLVREKASIGSEEEKKVVLRTVFYSYLEALKLFSIICPFVTEQIYLNMKSALKLKEESIHMYKWPRAKRGLIKEGLEKEFSIANNLIQSILAAREKASAGVRWPLTNVTIVTKDNEIIGAVNHLQQLIKKQVNVRNIKISEKLGEAKVEIAPNKTSIGRDFKADAPKIFSKLNTAIMESIFSKGSALVDNFELNMSHINVKETLPENLTGVEFRNGCVYIDTALTRELEEEGFAREVMRRVQALRKKEGLNRLERIKLSVYSDYDLSSWKEEIAKKVGAYEVSFDNKEYKAKAEEEIKGKKFAISFEKG